MTEAVFYLFATVAVLSALLCITQRNPIASAFWLISTMLCLAGIFVLLNAQFIGIIQVLVYAGAIMVLFLFVIMLLNLGREASDFKRWPVWILAAGVVVLLLAELAALPQYSAERLALEYTGSSRLADPAMVFEAGKTAAEAERDAGRHRSHRGPAVPELSDSLRAHFGAPAHRDRRRGRAGQAEGLMLIGQALGLSAILFTIGVAGVLLRRNAIVVFMCIELMLNAVNLSFVALAQAHGLGGQVFVFFVMTVAAAEAAVGLAIIIAMFRHHRSVDLKNINLLRG